MLPQIPRLSHYDQTKHDFLLSFFGQIYCFNFNSSLFHALKLKTDSPSTKTHIRESRMFLLNLSPVRAHFPNQTIQIVEHITLLLLHQTGWKRYNYQSHRSLHNPTVITKYSISSLSLPNFNLIRIHLPWQIISWKSCSRTIFPSFCRFGWFWANFEGGLRIDYNSDE